MAFQRDIKFCNVMVFTETWLDPSIPDSAIVPEGVSIHRQDRTTNSGKSKGGGVCCMGNNVWCSDVEIISSGCSPDLEHLMMPSYRQKLKRDRPVTRTIQRWTDQSDSALRDCFSITEWCVFQDDNINTYTDAVICYISKCIDDVVPRITVRSFPNQKPWINGDIHAKLKARTDAYISGDLEEYRKSRYALRSAISSAKRHYRDKVESHYKGSNTRNMWAGLKTISDYKAKTSSADVVSASLPEDLNTFYALRATPWLWRSKRPRRTAVPL
ncbi:uncharacterized protein LOC117764401 isoform X2 [Hippoglossus hippoglossus]|uniref:uncharacterized protein LOC117764401 isoform X2 n=1 Tax=Hippoglossus hippoglossus TaxID=8267 RepID=UPI00148CCA97|nr:uncharacterized protein LOC117764401 isoform X2 [Hippoglossus hippoglossus]